VINQLSRDNIPDFTVIKVTCSLPIILYVLESIFSDKRALNLSQNDMNWALGTENFLAWY
jgi:hypothetical protein